MKLSLTVYDEVVQEFINPELQLEVLADDCQFTEGPVWDTRGFYLFSDITANTVYKIARVKKKEVYIANSGTESMNDEDLRPDQVGSNGLAYDSEGRLLVCRHGSHMIARWDGHTLTPFITAYKGRPLNSPNDLIVDQRGRIFFSDPPYGLKEAKLNPDKFQPIGGVYCYDQGELRLICDKYQYPNGVCITPDGKELYICSNKATEKFISVYDLETLQFKRILAEETSDGIKCDPYGNVYLCNKDGVIIINKEGKRLALLQFPTVPANCCWGGENGNDLLVTARENVFLIPNLCC